MVDIKKILVPVDFSACSAKALGCAASFAKLFGASVDVLHVWEPPRYVAPELMVQVPSYPDQTVAQFARTEAAKEMERFLSELEKEAACEVQGRIESGDPTHMITDIASKDHYDLIVMGTHGRTGLSHLVLGSVAEKVVRKAHCPVVTVRTVKEDAPIM